MSDRAERTYAVAITVIVDVTASAADVIAVGSRFGDEMLRVVRSDARWRVGDPGALHPTGRVNPQRVSQVTLLGEAPPSATERTPT